MSGWAKPPNPTFEQVLANVRPGNVGYLALTPEQKRAFRDPEGQMGLGVFRHFLGARPPNPEEFPLTPEMLQAVARKLGHTIGQKRCRRMIHRLVAAGVIGRSGHYRQPYRNTPARSGYRVSLFKLGHRLLPLALRRSRRPRRERPVGTPAPVKRLRWWQHPLFGDIFGLPPPQFSNDLDRHRPLDQVPCRDWERELASIKLWKEDARWPVRTQRPRPAGTSLRAGSP